jgi:protein-tyrosine phosphatase
VVRLLAEEGLSGEIRVDSAGTGAYHVGESPDPRSVKVARKNGIELEGQSARQIRPEDLDTFDYVIVMDRSNLRNVESLGEGTAAIHLLREFDPESPEDEDVPDPYFGGPGGFDRVYEMVDRSCRRLLKRILADQGLD